MMQLITGNVNCQPVSTVKGDILSSLDLWTFMRIVFWCCWEENLSSCARKHHFLILRGRVLTRARWSETFWLYEAHNSFLVGVVQKLSKLIQIWKSCCKKFTATFLWATL